MRAREADKFKQRTDFFKFSTRLRFNELVMSSGRGCLPADSFPVARLLSPSLPGSLAHLVVWSLGRSRVAGLVSVARLRGKRV